MDCDLCGKEGDLYRALVEGSQVTVCNTCSKFGIVSGQVRSSRPEIKKPVATPQNELAEQIVSDLGRLIKKKREEFGMNQRDFARKIAEKESSLHNMEIGTLIPTIERARKLGRALGLSLVEEVVEEPVQSKKDQSVMTLGDYIKIKKR